MDNRPIGIFDSGLGGLTCVPYLMSALPNEEIIYFGDTARTPYGSKAVSTIRAFSQEIAGFLVENDVKMIVIACNTISSTCLDDLRKSFPGVPILGIISPAARKVANNCNAENHVGIIGTRATIHSNAYRKKIQAMQGTAVIFQRACPAFVPLIEEGIIQSEIMDLTIKHYLDAFITENRVDTLILGCTHYPLIRKNIESIYPGLMIIDPSEEILKSIMESLDINDLHADPGIGEHTFYASDLSENFVRMVDRIFEESEFDIVIKSINLDRRQMKLAAQTSSDAAKNTQD
ncbi:glutamate racemase [Clostridia bacterium]|nr:glutamate racemase [Clostridia bacterium]